MSPEKRDKGQNTLRYHSYWGKNTPTLLLPFSKMSLITETSVRVYTAHRVFERLLRDEFHLLCISAHINHRLSEMLCANYYFPS